MGSGTKIIKPFILGVTGVIASGKSVFCRFIEEKYGFNWINADSLVHELYMANNAGYRAIKEHFGEEFVGEKEVNRILLREFVLKNPEKLRILNEIIHPLVDEVVNKKVVHIDGLHKGKNKVLIVIEAVYFEPNMLGKFIDRKILIDASDDIILNRLRDRHIAEEQAEALIKVQRGVLPKNGEILTNNGTVDEFLEKAGKWAESLVQ